MSEIELKPCPFCGQAPVWFHCRASGIPSAILGCINDECFGPRTTAEGVGAIAQWNTRASVPAHDGWRPIETAPSDVDLQLCWQWADGRWGQTIDLARCSRGGWLHGQATHWRPLHKPPVLTAHERGDE